jgi:hypothetical protein
MSKIIGYIAIDSVLLDDPQASDECSVEAYRERI